MDLDHLVIYHTMPILCRLLIFSFFLQELLPDLLLQDGCRMTLYVYILTVMLNFI